MGVTAGPANGEVENNLLIEAIYSSLSNGIMPDISMYVITLKYMEIINFRYRVLKLA